MAIDDELPEGATPLEADEAADLKPDLSTRAELNAFEQTNIAQAISWARTSRKLKASLLSIDSLKLLYQRMFGDTWVWAGRFRTTGKNIGVEPHLIQTQLAALCGDCRYWLKHNTYPIDVCAIRFHHRLVFIHPFPNGNGRHARLAADLLMVFAGNTGFSWGGQSIDVEGATRVNYLDALRAADRGNYQLLIEFANRE